jgi:hypothetical protein
MLEEGEILKTWQMELPPDQVPQTVAPIQDHRLIYLDYEGEISNNRGVVKIWDRGTYEFKYSDEVNWVIYFHGSILNGNYLLHKINDTSWYWAFR